MDIAGVNINIEGFLSGLFKFGYNFVILLVVALIVGIGTYLLVRKSDFKKKIYIFEEVQGITQRVGLDTAKEIIVPNTSTRVFFLKNRKLYLPRPSKQTGINEYWYFIRRDGEWINIGLENINKTLDELGVNFDHTDMRYANASLKKLIDRSYQKNNWIKEYAPYIGMAMLVIMLGVTFFLIFGKAEGLLGQLSGIAENIKGMLEATDNICSTSGLKSAG